jgi:hypothetical protein
VFFPHLNEDEDFSQIYNQKLIFQRSQYDIHQPHESCLEIRQAKGHDQPLKNTFIILEGSLPYINIESLGPIFIPHEHDWTSIL